MESVCTHPIALLSALDREAEPSAARLLGRRTVHRFGITISTGRLLGRDVVVAVDGMGKVAAAAAAQALIAAYRPTALLFTGIAGAISPRLSVGDVVLGARLVALEANNRIIAECDPWMTSFPSDRRLLALAARATQARGFARTESLAERKAGPGEEPRTDRSLAGEPVGRFGRGRRYTVGTITSSDRFNTNPAVLEKSRDVVRGDCEEMEGSAAAQVCVKNRVPFLAIRSMSNRCGQSYEDLNRHERDMDWTAGEAAALADDVVAALARQGR